MDPWERPCKQCSVTTLITEAAGENVGRRGDCDNKEFKEKRPTFIKDVVGRKKKYKNKTQAA